MSLLIPVICGPTAAGKSAVAAWLALRREIVVISADSRQVYRRFDIGTAKPGEAERARVPHRCIDVADPARRFSAAEWTALAERAIAEAHAQRRVPVVVGGTGFYISSLFKPLWDEPPLDPDRRIALQQELSTMEIDELRRWCERLDPPRAHLGRAQLLRAIEIALLTGKRLSDLHVTLARPARYQASYLLVDPGIRLGSRIAARANGMFDAGWPDEVRALMADVPADAPAWNASGYDAMRDFVRGAVDRDGALDRIVVETRQYAKRQRTWFRHQLAAEPVRRMDTDESGWQEIVDRWMNDIETTERASRAS
ncbi:MAG TPA: tRNA (adenosine(37)-N6)-dimethylallyltransferase MiaA [Gemmatimonadaceae bacterium]|nr:tRNA (adenosine(37)-N6)-dimethylallyltransferase MiaA [Gemmatimonadaceae bacterium]